FIAALAHELRSPMSAILAAGEALTASPAEPTAVQSAGSVVLRQSRHVSNLIDQLLEVSRVANMRLNLNRSRVDLADVVERAIEAVRPALRAKRQEIELSMPDKPLVLSGDETRLIQLLVNLLDNASRYGGSGKAIRVEASRSNGEAVIRVRDEGRGSAPEALVEIFDLLYQADGEHSEAGLGIGLSLVRGIVEAHGGRVTAHSDGVGHGSEFVVRIPC